MTMRDVGQVAIGRIKRRVVNVLPVVAGSQPGGIAGVFWREARSA
jgi:hypothetical protein